MPMNLVAEGKIIFKNIWQNIRVMDKFMNEHENLLLVQIRNA